MTIVPRITIAIATTLILSVVCFADDPGAAVCTSANRECRGDDRIWLLNTRALPSEACRAPLTRPEIQVARAQTNGSSQRSSLDQFLSELSPQRNIVIQVHGNRMTAEDAFERGLFVYQQTAPHCGVGPIDFLIFSWPSDRDGILLKDGRSKAERTDAEGLYLAWLLREFAAQQIPVAIIGFSFGGRIATGALHALAGGDLGGRRLPGEHVQGAEVKVGLIAAALEDDWLREGNYHGLASKNIQRMSILYNRRDAVLKRYWLIDHVRGSMALGYTGPKGIGSRVDGSPMPVSSRDCSPTLGLRHDEKKYYLEDCRAGLKMAKLLETTY